jgi:hypothetical protein
VSVKLKKLATRVSQIPMMFEQEAQKEGVRQQGYISKLNVDQLKAGTKADDSDMPKYSPNSRSRHAPAKIKLWDTGDFHSGIEPLFESNEGFDMVGTDQKTNLLVGIYGKILGLNKESRAKLAKRMLPKLAARMLKRITVGI